MTATEATLGMLSQDITSEERWGEVLDRLNSEGCTIDYPQLGKPFSNVCGRAWYHQREQYRMTLEVYKTTSVLDKVNQLLPGYFIHIKVGHEDKQMVAYTSSAEDAKRDKKHLVRLGRLLTKLVPLFTDAYINDLCAEHVQESDPTLEILFGTDNIVDAYVNGPSSCMTKDASEYNGRDEHGNKHMPVEVYGTKRIGIAVTRDSNGGINGRCLVIPEKKVFIRVYGSPVLSKKLMMNDYKAGTLVDEELLQIVLNKEDATLNGMPTKKLRVLMPYLDGNGGQGSADWSAVAIIDGKLKVIQPKLRDRLQRMYAEASGVFAYATSTSGSMSLFDLKSENFALRDGITGEVVAEDSELVPVFYKGSVVNTSLVSWFANTEGPYVMARLLAANGQWQEVRMQRKDGIYFDGAWRAPTADFMKKYSIYLLDPQFYPGESKLVRVLGDKYVISGKPKTDGINVYIKASDSRVVVHTDDGQTECGRYYEHKSLATKERKLVKLHRLKGFPDVYAEPGVPIIKTNTGRKVVEGIHNIVELWNGEYVLRQPNVTCAVLFEDRLWYQGEMPAEFKLGGSVWVAHFRKMLGGITNMDIRGFVAAVNYVCSVAAYSTTVGAWSMPGASAYNRISDANNLPRSTDTGILDRLFVEKAVENAAISGMWCNIGTLTNEEARVVGAPFMQEIADRFFYERYRDAEARSTDYNQQMDNHFNEQAEEQGVEIIANPNIEIINVELEGLPT